MNDKPPANENWKDLYEAAAVFFVLAPWKWMYDSDLFGVQDPKTGEIGYCCVMGRLGEHFALGVYRGTRGYGSYMKIRQEEKETKDLDVLLQVQDCLMVSFGNEGYLDKEDFAVIDGIGFRSRAKAAGWPQFRSFLPGYYPWQLTADEAVRLTHALRQAVDVAKRFKDDPALFDPKGEKILVRTAKQQKGEIIWRESRMLPQIELPVFSVPSPDVEKLGKIKENNFPADGAWEMDFDVQNEPVVAEENSRPFFPMLLMIAHHETGFLFNCGLAPQDDLAALQNAMLKAIEDNRLIPSQVWTRQPVVAAALAPLAAALGFKVMEGMRLDAIVDARRHLNRFSRGILSGRRKRR